MRGGVGTSGEMAHNFLGKGPLFSEGRGQDFLRVGPNCFGREPLFTLGWDTLFSGVRLQFILGLGHTLFWKVLELADCGLLPARQAIGCSAAPKKIAMVFSCHNFCLR